MEAKVKVWIEDENCNLIFGSGKTEVLEFIDQTGSIKEASLKVGMNYKKAWSHIKVLQEFIEDELVCANKGRANGGTTLTPKAREVIQTYKILQHDVNRFAQKRFKELFKKDGKDILKAKEREDEGI